MMTLFTRGISLYDLLMIGTSIRRYSRVCFVLTLHRSLSSCFLSESRISLSKCCGRVICQERSLHSSKSAEMAVRIFEDKSHAELYARYRPTYPEGVPRTIVDYYKSGKGASCNFELAVDVGCGNGQSSRLLCSYFRHVIGLDVSTEQIASAPKDVGNLSFRVGPGEDLSFLQDNSVDVVTIAQALHWLDRGVFYKEVRRVLKPGGVFAVFGYGQNIPDDAEANTYMTEFYADLLGPYWESGRRHVDNHYKDMDHPFAGWERIENEEISIKINMPVNAYIGYLSTWSSWRTYLKEHPDSDALEQLRQRVNSSYKAKSGKDNSDMIVCWPGFMLIGRK